MESVCKKGCDADGDTWEECVSECEEICYKDPVLKDWKWSAYIDRSPGAFNYSEECFHACVAGSGYKYVERKLIKSNLTDIAFQASSVTKPDEPAEVVPSTSA